ncbi:hypothetical protein [Bradyrhizobium sp. AZCC 1693]|uniref:hypothetical protein n=1 Tax=Bradyrhizobium sp. AZCC 1693 TaxID=3117029 RepID=UPI002FF3F2B6
MSEGKKKDCFVVGPIGDETSSDRTHAEWVLEGIITPALEDEFVIYRADKLPQPGLIDTQVITHLLNDDLVIADITTLNANAFYEIGIRHMAQKPIIHMHKVGQKIPFDISAYRSIEFSLERPIDLKNATARLKSAVEAVLADGYKVDNPVTHARGVVHLQEQATDSQRVLLDEMAGIKERLNKIENNPSTAYVIVASDRSAKTQPSKTKPWEDTSVAAKSALAKLFAASHPDSSDTLELRLAELGKDKLNEEKEGS